MNIDLAGKTAIVTGSTEGIGLAIARGLARAGASVVLNGRTRDKVDAAVKQMSDGTRGIAADLASSEGCAALVDAAPDPDIVVSNLGIFTPVDFFDTDDALWTRTWEVNVMAGRRLAQAWLPVMEKSGWGRFIFIGSESAFNIPPDVIHYGTTKAAVVALARGLAKRMSGSGVTVNSVLPGPTMTEAFHGMLAEAGRKSGKTADEAGAAFVAEHRPSSVIKRMASVEEVANMVVYLASPLSSATTGAALRVDGGVIDTLM